MKFQDERKVVKEETNGIIFENHLRYCRQVHIDTPTYIQRMKTSCIFSFTSNIVLFNCMQATMQRRFRSDDFPGVQSALTHVRPLRWLVHSVGFPSPVSTPTIHLNTITEFSRYHNIRFQYLNYYYQQYVVVLRSSSSSDSGCSNITLSFISYVVHITMFPV